MAAPRYKSAPHRSGPVAVMYVGPLRPGVTVAETGTFCAYRSPVEFPAELAERLLRQACWAPVPAVPTPPQAVEADPPAEDKEKP